MTQGESIVAGGRAGEPAEAYGAERRFRARLTLLHEVTNELSKATDFDAFCRLVIELGRAKLGFERLGMWFVSDDPNVAVGSFGTDEEGRTRDERGARARSTPDSKLGAIWAQRDRYIVDREVPLRNGLSEIVGTGMAVFAALWNGERVIGSLNADNYLTHRDLTDDDAELLSLYASAVGHLCSRLQAERALQRSEALYRAVVQSQTDAVVRLDVDGVLQFVNEAFCEMLGCSREDCTGRSLGAYVAGAEHLATAWQDLRRLTPDRPTKRLELRLRPRDDRLVWVEWDALAIFDAAGRLVGFQGVGRDVTVRRAMEEALVEQREQLRQLSTELARAEERQRQRVAMELHDGLGQNLAGASIRLEALRAGLADERALREIAGIQELIEQTIEGISNLTFEIYPPVLSQNGLGAAAEWLVDRFRAQYNIATVLELSLGEPITEAAQALLFQALRELLHNVVKHARASLVTVSLTEPHDEVVLAVADDGVGCDGIAAAARRSGPGGFGLFSIQERLRYLGGSLEVETEPGMGTRVTLCVPRLAMEATG